MTETNTPQDADIAAAIAEARANRFGLTQPEWTAMLLGISPYKFGTWRKRLKRRRAKNKVARASRKANR